MCVVAPQRTAMPARRRLVLMSEECGVCGQLSAWCVCGQEWEYGADLSACNVSDEQLPCGVYRDENGELYDEDH